MNKRDGYSDAIEKVRSAHRSSIPAARTTMECPRCHTRQVINDVPGQRTCVGCGFEFRPAVRGLPPR